MSVDAGFNNPATGFGAAETTEGGAPVQDGQAVTVKPANNVSPTYQGTADVQDDAVTVTLPATVAMVAANESVGLATSQGSNAGNGTAFVNVGALTNVRLPAGNALVGDGSTIPLSKEDNTGLLAMVATHVVDDLLQNIALPHNYAITEDGNDGTIVNQFDGSGGVAMVASVSQNQVSFTLANSTTRIVINAAPVSVKTTGGASAGATFDIDQGALNGVTLAANFGIVQDGTELTVPVTGTYTSKITPQVDADGNITGFTLS